MLLGYLGLTLVPLAATHCRSVWHNTLATSQWSLWDVWADHRPTLSQRLRMSRQSMPRSLQHGEAHSRHAPFCCNLCTHASTNGFPVLMRTWNCSSMPCMHRYLRQPESTLTGLSHSCLPPEVAISYSLWGESCIMCGQSSGKANGTFSWDNVCKCLK